MRTLIATKKEDWNRLIQIDQHNPYIPERGLAKIIVLDSKGRTKRATKQKGTIQIVVEDGSDCDAAWIVIKDEKVLRALAHAILMSIGDMPKERITAGWKPKGIK